jgi:hypothetical protein
MISSAARSGPVADQLYFHFALSLRELHRDADQAALPTPLEIGCGRMPRVVLAKPTTVGLRKAARLICMRRVAVNS